MQILCMYLLTTWKRAWRKHAQCTYQWFWSLWNMTHIYIQCCGKFWDKSLVSQHSVNHQQQPWNTLCRNGTMHCNGASGQLCSAHHGSNQCAPVQLFVASDVSLCAFKPHRKRLLSTVILKVCYFAREQAGIKFTDRPCNLEGIRWISSCLLDFFFQLQPCDSRWWKNVFAFNLSMHEILLRELREEERARHQFSYDDEFFKSAHLSACLVASTTLTGFCRDCHSSQKWMRQMALIQVLIVIGGHEHGVHGDGWHWQETGDGGHSFIHGYTWIFENCDAADLALGDPTCGIIQWLTFTQN